MYFHIFRGTNICLFIMRYRKTSFTFSMKLLVKGLLTILKQLRLPEGIWLSVRAALRGIEHDMRRRFNEAHLIFVYRHFIFHENVLNAYPQKFSFNYFNKTYVKMKKNKIKNVIYNVFKVWLLKNGYFYLQNYMLQFNVCYFIKTKCIFLVCN